MPTETAASELIPATVASPSPAAGPTPVLVSPSAKRLPDGARRALALSLLGLLALQAILTSRQTSPAYDEVSLVPAGYVLLKTGQWHNLFPHHPPLIGALSALPLLALQPALDP